MLDYIHLLNTGNSGSGKSRLAATAPTPQLVALFDSLGNARPYFRNCRVKQTRDVVIVLGKPTIIPTYLCYAADDVDLTTLLRKLWHFDPATGIGKVQFDIKRPLIMQEMRDINAKTFILDSLTLFTTAMRVYGKRNIGSTSQDEEALAYATTDYIEDLTITLCSLPCNVILCAHISDRIYTRRGTRKGDPGQVVKDTFVNAPGRMARNLTAMFSDVWYCSVDVEDQYTVLTQSDNEHIAKNTVNAPRTVNITDEENSYDKIVASSDPIIWVE